MQAIVITEQQIIAVANKLAETCAMEIDDTSDWLNATHNWLLRAVNDLMINAGRYGLGLHREFDQEFKPEPRCIVAFCYEHPAQDDILCFSHRQAGHGVYFDAPETTKFDPQY